MQHGFRQYRSCLSSILLSTEQWTRALDEDGRVDVIYTDFKKAFDSVPQKRLIYKLSEIGIRGRLLTWITDFLTERSQTVCIEASRSTPTPVLSGVPQGSVLGPLIFLIYINDCVDDLGCSAIMFADDVKLWRAIRSDADRQLRGDLIQTYRIVRGLETEVAEGETIQDSDDEDEIEEKDTNFVGDEEKLSLTEDDFPKNRWKPPPTIPPEEFREGVNKYVYFVCHFPGGRWIRLPHVKPQQICVARQICRFFTGNLDAPVESFPIFPGTEANYLRAQIARITACTHVSPEGYFSFEDEEGEEEYDDDEEEEEDRAQRECIRNLEYAPLPITQLGHPGLKHWVHHSPYILPQGRVRWLNPASLAFDEASEQSFEKEEEDELAETKLVGLNDHAERGLPLLTSISNDIDVYGQMPWSVRVFDSPSPEQACVLVSSNLWVGAHAIAWDSNYDNIYIGWGLKSTGPGLSPYTPPEPMEEATEQHQEATDPTPEEEAAANEPEEAPEETDSEDLDEQGLEN
nr:unnamed protein product [Spirometra erinaceieuropaei]